MQFQKSCLIAYLSLPLFVVLFLKIDFRGEVLIEVHAAGICGSDILRIFTTGTYHFSNISGHEFSGKVVKAADELGEAWNRKRVGVFH